jgi:hypothetical protein
MEVATVFFLFWLSTVPVPRIYMRIPLILCPWIELGLCWRIFLVSCSRDFCTFAYAVPPPAVLQSQNYQLSPLFLFQPDSS